MALSRSLLSLLLLAPTLAQADPVSITTETQVARGRRPTITVRAEERISNVALELTREEDKAKLTVRLPGLRAGQSKTFPIGDGAIGASRWEGTLSLTYGAGELWSSPISVEMVVNAEIRVGYRRDHLHLDRHVLEFQISRPSRKLEVSLTVIGDGGHTIGDGEQTFEKVAAGKWLPVSWEQREDVPVMKMLLHAADDAGFVDEVLTPWMVSIPHEEVNFASNSYVIDEGERPKLDAAYDAIVAEVTKAEALDVRCSLFISGHTDTVGSSDKNLTLSVNRAKAIADYFRAKGLKIKVSYAGFGESRLKVATPDNTDERANRRADYTLSAEGPPSEGQFFREAK